MDTIILAVYVIIAVSLIGLILIQHGKGADAGANFGGGSSGASDTVFGSQGSGNFLTKTTGVLATLFFSIALMLSYLSTLSVQKKDAPIIAQPQPQTQQSTQKSDIPSIPDALPPVVKADKNKDASSKTAADKPAIPE
ncbi:MAG: preprotein translocase subunit SecG [Pseudomonadota bacterium]